MKFKLFSVAVVVVFLSGCGGGGSAAPGATPPKSSPVLGISVPATREDGSKMLETEIDSYRVYYGTVSGDYQIQLDIDPANPVFDFTGLASGTYYAVFTTIDADSRESLYSAEVVTTI